MLQTSCKLSTHLLPIKTPLSCLGFSGDNEKDTTFRLIGLYEKENGSVIDTGFVSITTAKIDGWIVGWMASTQSVSTNFNYIVQCINDVYANQ